MEFLVAVLLVVLFVRWFQIRERLRDLEERIANVAVDAQKVHELTKRVWRLEEGITPEECPAEVPVAAAPVETPVEEKRTEAPPPPLPFVERVLPPEPPAPQPAQTGMSVPLEDL